MTSKQAKFAESYLETGNATEAAMTSYNPKNRATASVMGHENLRKPKIRAFLEEKATDAIAMIYKLSQKARSENVRFNASRDILDRAGYFVNKDRAREADKSLPLPLMFGRHEGDAEKIQRVVSILQELEGKEYVEGIKKDADETLSIWNV
ncbi:MAG: terminase small subunit [Patescibacteria group bacterium]